MATSFRAPLRELAKLSGVNSVAEVLRLKGHTGLVLSSSFGSDGSRVVTGSSNQMPKVWGARPFTPKELASRPGL
jgi:hypothetical protein